MVASDFHGVRRLSPDAHGHGPRPPKMRRIPLKPAVDCDKYRDSTTENTQNEQKNIIEGLLHRVKVEWLERKNGPRTRMQSTEDTSSFARFEQLFFGILELDETLSKHNLPSLRAASDLLDLDSNLIRESLISPLILNVYNVHSFLEHYSMVHLSGLVRDMDRVTRLKSGIDAFFKVYSDFNDEDVVGHGSSRKFGEYMGFYSNVRRHIETEFKSLCDSKDKNLIRSIL